MGVEFSTWRRNKFAWNNKYYRVGELKCYELRTKGATNYRLSNRSEWSVVIISRVTAYLTVNIADAPEQCII